MNANKSLQECDRLPPKNGSQELQTKTAGSSQIQIDLDCRQIVVQGDRIRLRELGYRFFTALALRAGKSIPVGDLYWFVWEVRRRDEEGAYDVVRKRKQKVASALSKYPWVQIVIENHAVSLTVAEEIQVSFGLNGTILEEKDDPLFWGIDLRALLRKYRRAQRDAKKSPGAQRDARKNRRVQRDATKGDLPKSAG